MEVADQVELREETKEKRVEKVLRQKRKNK
jgi:hypothetical protein